MSDGKKKVLGRGLGALMGDVAPSVAGKERYKVLATAEISPNASQPRKHFDDAALSELADSIREKGIIEPLIVRRHAPGYELIAGERRWRAARLAGLTEVPVVITDATDEECLELAIIENVQREDLNAIEEAEAYKTLTNFGLSQDAVAKKVGKERATVANYLRLLRLPLEVKDELVKGRISMGHARSLLSIEGHAAQTELCRRIIAKGLSVREAEALANKGAPGKAKKAKTAPHNPVEDELREIFGTRIVLRDKGGKGAVEIIYYSADERERIIDLLRSVRG
ncbi:MAG: ParB/RepB/Spo0J family partition protein [Deltaproteobacteria bacterium]|nr:ParB/RepB/Spo0J family partition protein [Deltaproteobacteria bacterium]